MDKNEKSPHTAVYVRSKNNFAAGLSEQQQRELTPERKAITSDSSVINKKHVLNNKENHVIAFLNEFYACDKRSRFHIKGTGEYINFYADHCPEDGNLEVFYTHYDANSTIIDTKKLNDLSDDEIKSIMQLMKNAEMDEDAEDISENQDIGMSLQ